MRCTGPSLRLRGSIAHVGVLSFDETMVRGQAQYQDVIDELTRAGLPATFTQTGGMNAALEVFLDGGYSLLITDAEDSLAWARYEHSGWTVSLYAPEEAYDGSCVMFGTTENGGAAVLRPLIEEVLRAAVGRSAPAD